MMRRVVRFTLAGLLASVAVVSAKARAQDREQRLGRLDPQTRAAVLAAIDSARLAGLPTEPLYDRAVEGSMKSVPGPRIVVAVRSLAGQLGTAREALSPTADPNEIKAGAVALQAGLAGRDLARVRRAAPVRRLTAMLTALADLVARKVPAPTSTDVIVSLASAGVTDGELALYQRDVHNDLSRGADPTSAAVTRARGIIEQRQAAPDAHASARHIPHASFNGP